MEFKLTREQLQNDLLYDALCALSKVMNDLQLEVFIVGALARDIAMEILKMPPSPRRTADLDVAITLKDWSQFELLKEHLLKNHFIKGEPKQRFYYQGEDGNNDYEIDIVPFGELEADEKVAWPPEGNPEMSVKCFKDVMNIADTVVIDDAITIKMAPLSGQFLIKFDTWLDRHLLTDKDASDMLYIMDSFYLAYVSFKQPVPDDVEEDSEDFDLLKGGAKWIACEMREFLSKEHLQFYIDQLQEQIDLDENSPLLRTMSRNYPASNGHMTLRNTLIGMTNVLRKGIKDED
ncbi:hypothetical protein HMPREF1212_02335 [Parabacteroides sp. HGS0025]|uniref:hypothetical protein n=1 Tax=Parabacteroides sp. HGS0025 TaxID=1078087 RepID=UPI0006175444|nr:hypothetical protein [Parabacteroides sp. HGS0025]KKB51604.1 hypothetical protein HMPREF1212_02335 [Parabacteroides sp. HGS0025]